MKNPIDEEWCFVFPPGFELVRVNIRPSAISAMRGIARLVMIYIKRLTQRQ